LSLSTEPRQRCEGLKNVANEKVKPRKTSGRAVVLRACIEQSAYARLNAHDVHLKLMTRRVSAQHLDQALLFGLVNAGAPAIIGDIPDMPGLGGVDCSDIRVFHPAPPLASA
jgi:hypothetical protein